MLRSLRGPRDDCRLPDVHAQLEGAAEGVAGVHPILHVGVGAGLGDEVAVGEYVERL